MDSSLPLTYIQGWDQPALTRYQVLKRLAAESTGTVYLVLDTLQQRHMRLKVMRPSPEGEKPATTNGKEGVSLRSILRVKQPMPPERVLRIGVALCRALAGAHGVGVAHPRLRAESVLVRPGDEVSIADFVNRKLEPIPLAALAPEVRRGGPPTPRSDIYAVGVILYECLTSRLPADIPVPPSAWATCPPALDAVIMRALDADPEERFLSIAAFESALSGDFAGPADVTATSLFPGVPREDLEHDEMHEQPTLILRDATLPLVEKVRRTPRLMMCMMLFALLLEGTIAPACSGWSREAPRIVEHVKLQIGPVGWPR